MLTRFHCPERQGEEPHFREWFQVEGFALHEVPAGTSFEGEGDALWALDSTSERKRLWAGHGWRTAESSHAELHELWPEIDIVPLRLVDPRFYHLDTCFAPLANGDLLYYPPAFDAASRAAIEQFYAEPQRIAVTEQDATQFACNAVNIGQVIILNEISPALCRELASRGFDVVTTPLGEFLKAGGAAKCLCLRLG